MRNFVKQPADVFNGRTAHLIIRATYLPNWIADRGKSTVEARPGPIQ
jgi:hypothetical protein